MNYTVKDEHVYRDRAIEILDYSRKLRAKWRSHRGVGLTADKMRDEVDGLLVAAGRSGVSIASPANRDAVEYEIDLWRQWIADELGEYYPPVELAPSQITQDELVELDYPNLIILLRQGETVSGRSLRGIEFAKHLSEVREAFRESKLVNCRFEHCKFDGAQFGAGTKLVYVTFVECSLDYCLWPNVRALSLAFEHLDVHAAGFESGTFADVLFRKLRTDRVVFMDANFTYCRFDATEIVGTSFVGAIFSHCIFTGAQFTGCDFSAAVFSECDFSDATIAGGSLRDSYFTKCDFGNLKLTKGPPRGGDASRRLQVDTDLSDIRIKDCMNLPDAISAHLSVQDIGYVPSSAEQPEGAA